MLTASRASLSKESLASLRGQHIDNILAKRASFLKWWDSHYVPLPTEDPNIPSHRYRNNVHLRLDYCLIRMFVGWHFLLSSITKTSLPTENAHAGLITELEDDCVAAALEIINLCSLLQNRFGLARVSFTEFSPCRGALLAVLARYISDKGGELHGAFVKGLKMLTIMSMGIGLAPPVVTSIESLHQAASHLGVLEGAVSQPAATPFSQYESFCKWVAQLTNEPSSIEQDLSQTWSIPGYSAYSEDCLLNDAIESSSLNGLSSDPLLSLWTSLLPQD